MSILGIDYGSKKIGLAKAGEGSQLALPLEILANTGQAEILTQLKLICQQEDVKKIVVGLPLSLNSSGVDSMGPKDWANKQLQEVQAFINWLKDNFDLPIEPVDERLSTKMANGLRKDMVKKGPDDAVAAMLILQNYLDRNRI